MISNYQINTWNEITINLSLTYDGQGDAIMTTGWNAGLRHLWKKWNKSINSIITAGNFSNIDITIPDLSKYQNTICTTSRLSWVNTTHADQLDSLMRKYSTHADQLDMSCVNTINAERLSLMNTTHADQLRFFHAWRLLMQINYILSCMNTTHTDHLLPQII